VPTTEVASSFDHAVSLGDQSRGYVEAKLLCRLEVDNKFEMGFLEKRHMCGACISYFAIALNVRIDSRLQWPFDHEQAGLQHDHHIDAFVCQFAQCIFDIFWPVRIRRHDL
jgi:hypothetical protein